jgi:hypothetical protein
LANNNLWQVSFTNGKICTMTHEEMMKWMKKKHKDGEEIRNFVPINGYNENYDSLKSTQD